MDISETWKKLDEERLAQPIEGDFIKQSKHPLSKLKKNYFFKTIMLVFIVIGFAATAFYFDEPLIKGVFTFITIAYIAFLSFSFLTYKKIEIDGPVIEVLTRTRDQITRSLRLETLTSLMIYPFTGAGGYFAGFALNGRTAESIFSNTKDIVMFFTMITILTVVGYFLGRTLTRAGYQKSLDEISRMIEQLKS